MAKSELPNIALIGIPVNVTGDMQYVDLRQSPANKSIDVCDGVKLATLQLSSFKENIKVRYNTMIQKNLITSSIECEVKN